MYELVIDGVKTEKQDRLDAVTDAMIAEKRGHFAAVIERDETGKRLVWPEEEDHRRAGFTLVELMVTVTIIGILVGLASWGLSVGRRMARVDSTLATVHKIDDILHTRWAAFQTRRLPLDESQQREIAMRCFEWVPAPENPGLFPADVRARVVVYARRDLMRMELPDRWSDVASDRAELILPLPFSTAQTSGYLAAYNAALSGPGAASVPMNAAAECLYLIVMSDPEAAAMFHAYEIADTDGDGLKEFIDGWERPIRWLRWPAGWTITDGGTADPSTPDPFDPSRITGDYLMWPLVYSAGPDGKYDINIGKDSSGKTWAYELDTDGAFHSCQMDQQMNPETIPDTPGPQLIGEPLDENVENDDIAPDGDIKEHLNHYDNITNTTRQF